MKKPANNPDRPAYLSVEAVVERLGVSRQVVVRWIQRGELPALCASALPDSRKPRYRIRPADLEAFEIARTVQPTPPPRRRRRPNYRRIV